MSRLKHAFAQWLGRQAQSRLRRDHPEWADAMAAEVEHLAGHGPELRWAAGCVGASYRTGRALEVLRYGGALGLGLAAMTLDQWTQDEGIGTCVVLGLLALLLGALRPQRFLLSGTALGAVVTAVHLFGALSGVRPPYETTAHSLAGGLRWLLLVPPAVLAAAAGSQLSRSARPA